MSWLYHTIEHRGKVVQVQEQRVSSRNPALRVTLGWRARIELDGATIETDKIEATADAAQERLLNALRKWLDNKP